MSDVFKLDAADKNSGTWRKLLAHLNEKLKNARGQNDGFDKDAVTTAHLRGQISTLKALIALDQDDIPE